MTDPATEQRDALRARIEVAERRNAERSLTEQAREAASTAADYTRANPLTVIGGAVAVGLLIGLLTRPGRRAAGQALHNASEALSEAASTASSGVRRVAWHSGSRLGEVIGEAAMGYVLAAIEELIETARTGQERAEVLTEAAGKEARKLSASASDAAGAAADGTREIVRKAVDVAASVVREISGKTKG
jgi:ElaB/YqjD/DUF883 family membrane-anchored ribosome-binding protein